MKQLMSIERQVARKIFGGYKYENEVYGNSKIYRSSVETSKVHIITNDVRFCIDKMSSAELSLVINSMFHWYQNATKCYAYLSDVSICDVDRNSALRQSRWSTRGWTLQEFLAPKSVDFSPKEGKWHGNRESLKELLCNITGVAIEALEDKKTYWN
jgi:hypothetical protein